MIIILFKNFYDLLVEFYDFSWLSMTFQDAWEPCRIQENLSEARVLARPRWSSLQRSPELSGREVTCCLFKKSPLRSQSFRRLNSVLLSSHHILLVLLLLIKSQIRHWTSKEHATTHVSSVTPSVQRDADAHYRPAGPNGRCEAAAERTGRRGPSPLLRPRCWPAINNVAGLSGSDCTSTCELVVVNAVANVRRRLHQRLVSITLDTHKKTSRHRKRISASRILPQTTAIAE